MNHFELNIIDRKIKYNNIYKMDISQVQAVQIEGLINQGLSQRSTSAKYTFNKQYFQ